MVMRDVCEMAYEPQEQEQLARRGGGYGAAPARGTNNAGQAPPAEASICGQEQLKCDFCPEACFGEKSI